MNEKQTKFLRELKNKVTGEIHTNLLYRQMYSTDASNYQIRPLAVLCPSSVPDVVHAVKSCLKYGISVISRGGGSSVSGQSIGAGLIIDYTKYLNQVIYTNWEEQWTYVNAGITLHNLNQILSKGQKMIGPDPSSALVATIGGMTANNSTGTHSIRYGMMADHVEAVDVILANGDYASFDEKTAEEVKELSGRDSLEGRLYRGVVELLEKYEEDIKTGYPDTWRNVAGYNLHRLLKSYREDGRLNLATLMVGSEGTLGSIVNVKLKIVGKPPYTRLAIVHFEELKAATSAVPEILKTSASAIELSNRYFLELVDGNPLFGPIQRQFVKGQPDAILMVEYSAEEEAELASQLDHLYKALSRLNHRGDVVLRVAPAEIAAVWQTRKAGFGLMMSQRRDDKPLTFADDATVPVNHLPAYIEELEGIMKAEGVKAAMLGHASAGCIHVNPNINLKTEEGVRRMQKMAVAIAETAIKYQGSITGEHGEGLSRSYFTKQMYGPRLHQAFQEVKTLFDPKNIMNPGRIVEAVEPWDTSILRFYPNYETPEAPPKTYLDFSKDGGFAGLVEMCNGTGFCRKDGDGVMCPSYRATRDERHSTRGRANALRAAIKGELPKGLSNDSLYETLDLCLECKACKNECPTIVDMAKLKYEFLAQYQDKHGVPLKSRLFANIHKINRFSSSFQSLANASFKNKFLRFLLEFFLDIDRRRTIPPIAKNSFQEWFQSRPSPTRDAPLGEVVLWDDTYLSYNYPEIGKAAVKVLEAAGLSVRLIEGRVCCGRPMISKGLLKQAGQQVKTNVDLLLPYAQKGIPILGLEPSCIATFKDEYVDLLPGKEAKIVAKQCYFIEDFMMDLFERQELRLSFKESAAPQKILLHGHCYQKALGDVRQTVRLLSLIPNTIIEEIPSGCCGMAGSFGYEKAHYDISMACGEERLFPTIRQKEEKNTVIAAAGVSCRSQILDGTGKKASHPLTILAKALE